MTAELQKMIRQASDLRRAGRLLEAEHAYKVVLSNEPNLPECWYNLAFVQRLIGRYETALMAYAEALKLGIKQPEDVHLNRAVILSDHLNRPEEAEAELSAALRIQPAFIPAMLNLANLKEEQGNRDAALSIYSRILTLDPRCYEAQARAARLQMVPDPNDKLIADLDRAIADPKSKPADKASLAFAKGKLLDECGAYAKAFAAYTAANTYAREMAPAGTKLYDRQAHEAFVDQLIATFSHAGAVPDAPPHDDPPIFICGMFRSGSTLVEQVLARHPAVAAGGEVDFFPRLVNGDLAPFPAAMNTVTAQKLAQIADWHRRYYGRIFPNAKRFTDKRPDNFLYIGLIKALFPNAKIVHTTRDPLDTSLSVYFTHIDHSMGYALDLMDIGHYYKQYRRLMAHWQKLFPHDVLDFDYDAFVRAPKPAVERLLAFCDLPWDDACLAFHEAKNPVKTASVWQVRQPLYATSSGRWRRYAGELAPLKAYLESETA